jgi:small subunit ribosomal protein S6
MRPYEIVIIFDASLEEDAIRAVLDRVSDVTRSRGGSTGKVDRWGRRRFAYELAHRWEGYYVLLEVSADVDTVNELNRMLFLADEVLRHKVIRLPERAETLRRPGPPTGRPMMARTD